MTLEEDGEKRGARDAGKATEEHAEGKKETAKGKH
jgi:hypothetical protein